MEANLRWSLVTAIAPVAWGANYFVTRAFLPAGQPLYGSAIRALPAGLLLLAVCRELPRGSWWWKSLLLGVLNMGGFFALVYVAAQRLPSSVAATVMATGPLTMMLIAWPLVGERPGSRHLAGAGLGAGGVALMLFTGSTSADPLGVLAAVVAMAMSALGYVLAKRWSAGAGVLASASWQLLGGGLLLLPFAVVVEGAPPAVDGRALFGFGYAVLVATALAFATWFAGLRRLPAATVGLLGLLNPVTGVLLGTVVAGETLTPRQLCGLLLAVGGIFLGRPKGRETAEAAPASATSPTVPAPAPPPGRVARMAVDEAPRHDSPPADS